MKPSSEHVAAMHWSMTPVLTLELVAFSLCDILWTYLCEDKDSQSLGEPVWHSAGLTSAEDERSQ